MPFPCLCCLFWPALRSVSLSSRKGGQPAELRRWTGADRCCYLLQLPRPAKPAGRPARMNPSDFAGLYWYKLLIPCFTWGSIIGTFLGPLLFPTAWFLFVAAFMIVFVLVSLCQVRILCAVIPCMHACVLIMQPTGA